MTADLRTRIRTNVKDMEEVRQALQAISSLSIPRNNPAGDGAPTSSDDSTKGYMHGSVWTQLDATGIGDSLHMCVDNTVGGADWIEIATLSGGIPITDIAKISSASGITPVASPSKSGSTLQLQGLADSSTVTFASDGDDIAATVVASALFSIGNDLIPKGDPTSGLIASGITIQDDNDIVDTGSLSGSKSSGVYEYTLNPTSSVGLQFERTDGNPYTVPIEATHGGAGGYVTLRMQSDNRVELSSTTADYKIGIFDGYLKGTTGVLSASATVPVTDISSLQCFKTIAVPGGTNPVADDYQGTATFATGANSGVNITGDSSTDTVNFALGFNSNLSDIGEALESADKIAVWNNSGSAHASVAWSQISALFASPPPFVDTTEIVKGDGDATKRMRFEADGITTLTTRVITLADQDISMVPGTDYAGIASANTLTGANVFTSSLGIFGAISPALITASQNNYSPTGFSTCNVMRLTSDASWNITGLAAQSNGHVVVIHNIGSNNIVLTDQDALSSASNRFAIGADVTLSPDTAFAVRYDDVGAGSRWRAISMSDITEANLNLAGLSDGFAKVASGALTTQTSVLDSELDLSALTKPANLQVDAGGSMISVQVTEGVLLRGSSVRGISDSSVKVTQSGAADVQLQPVDANEDLQLLGGATSGDVFCLDLFQLRANSAMRFTNTTNTNYIELNCAAGLAADTSYTLPSADGSPNQFLQTDGAGALTWATALTSVTAHNLLSTTHGDTTADTVVRGDLITGQDVSPTWKRLAISGTADNVLRSDGTDATWSKVVLTSDVSGVLPEANGGTNQSTYATGDILYSDTTDSLVKRGIGTEGHVLKVVSGVPNWAAEAGGASDLYDTITGDSGSATPSGSSTLLFTGGVGITTAVTEPGTDTVTISIDEENIPYTPVDNTDWNNDADPGDVDDALDQLADRASVLESLLPPSAPALDDIGYNTSNGVAGKNTWNEANPLSPDDYASAADAGSANNSGDALDITMTASGNYHGVCDYDTLASVTGDLNEDVVADTGTPTAAYPNDSFSPGGSASGNSTNNLVLKVNGSTVHTVDLLTAGAGSDTNANGSGFNLSAATFIKFPNGDDFTAQDYRTGSWTVDILDLNKGYNVIHVEHVTDSGTETTDKHEFILDDDDTATTFTSESLTGLTQPNTKTLSGVTYNITPVTATYAVTINNQYLKTYSSGSSAINFNGSNCSVSNDPSSLSASAGNENKTTVVSETATVNQPRILNGSISVTTTAQRTVQDGGTLGVYGTATSSGDSISGLLYDNVSATSTDVAEEFDDEDYRIQSDVDIDDNTSYDTGGTRPSAWLTTESLVGADAGHNDGLLVSNDRVQYPTQGANSGNFGGITNAPGGNPNYSAASGDRVYLRYFWWSTNKQNFTISIGGSSTTFVSAATGLSSNNCHLEMLAPATTQDSGSNTEWKDCVTTYTDNDGIGCYSSGSKTVGTSNWVVTLGTRNTSTSDKVILLRLTSSSAWTGNITSLSVSA